MNPVLLTGATGFIGQHLQSMLLKSDTAVTAVVRPSSRNADAIRPEVRRIECDLFDSDRLIPAIRQAEAVIYCAGSVRGRELADFSPANIEGVGAVVDAMNREGSGRPLLLVSSLAASRPHVSDYANSKYLGEQELVRNATFPWTIFRPPAVYGPGDKEMLPILKLARRGIIASPGPADQRLSMVHVDDLASAVRAWLNSPEPCFGETYTLDDGHEDGYDWEQIAQACRPGRRIRLNIPAWLLFTAARVNLVLSRLLGYAPMLTPGKASELTQPDWLCDNAALTVATGWSPAIALAPGVESLFRDSGD